MTAAARPSSAWRFLWRPLAAAAEGGGRLSCQQVSLLSVGGGTRSERAGPGVWAGITPGPVDCPPGDGRPSTTRWPRQLSQRNRTWPWGEKKPLSRKCGAVKRCIGVTRLDSFGLFALLCAKMFKLGRNRGKSGAISRLRHVNVALPAGTSGSAALPGHVWRADPVDGGSTAPVHVSPKRCSAASSRCRHSPMTICI